MANALLARLTSLTFGGIDLQRSDLSIHLDVVSGLNDGLEVRGEDSTIPSLAGQFPRNRQGHRRTILLGGLVQGTGVTEATRQSSFQDLCDELEATFPLVGAASTRVKTLVGQARDGTWREIDAVAENIVWNEDDLLGACTVSIALVSLEPNWQVTGGGS